MPFTPQKSSLLPLSGALAEFALPTVLPDDVVALKALLRVQNSTLLTQVQAHQMALDAQRQALTAEIDAVRRDAQEQITRMIEQLVLARHRQFGVSTEQLPGQARLFDEVEVLAQVTTEADDIAPLPPQAPAVDAGGDKTSTTSTTSTTPARGKRRPLPSELPRVDVVHDVPEGQRICPCGTPMVEIGQDVSEQLDIVPMQVRVLRHVRKRYGCPGSAHAPVTALLPPQPLPKSNASPDFLAMLLVVKFIDGLPLARWVIGKPACCNRCTT